MYVNIYIHFINKNMPVSYLAFFFFTYINIPYYLKIN